MARTELCRTIAFVLFVVLTMLATKSYDRWTRSDQKHFCREVEAINPGFQCPKDNP